MLNEVKQSGSPKFPWIIRETPEQVFGMVARLMDPKRDGGPNFAVTHSRDVYNLWLSNEDKEYLYG